MMVGDFVDLMKVIRIVWHCSILFGFLDVTLIVVQLET